MAGRSSENRYEDKEVIATYLLLAGLAFMTFALVVLAIVVFIVAIRWAVEVAI